MEHNNVHFITTVKCFSILWTMCKLTKIISNIRKDKGLISVPQTGTARILKTTYQKSYLNRKIII